MSGMSTGLHLIADQEGDYRGVSANLSGEGFAGMDFTVRATPRDEFDSWVQNIQHSSKPLDQAAYTTLAKPSKNVTPIFYTLPNKGLYDTVVMKYMPAGHGFAHSTSNNPSSGNLNQSPNLPAVTDAAGAAPSNPSSTPSTPAADNTSNYTKGTR